MTLRSRWTNMNALHYAAYFDVPDLVRVLLKGARPRGEEESPGWEGARTWVRDAETQVRARLRGKGGWRSEETAGGWRRGRGGSVDYHSREGRGREGRVGLRGWGGALRRRLWDLQVKR